MLAGRCTHHPDRTAVGVCVLCRTVICIECSTPIEGIHRCARCIAGLGAPQTGVRPETAELHPATLLLALTSFGLLTLVWMGLAGLLR